MPVLCIISQKYKKQQNPISWEKYLTWLQKNTKLFINNYNPYEFLHF
jgi:hypothetical protein